MSESPQDQQPSSQKDQQPALQKDPLPAPQENPPPASTIAGIEKTFLRLTFWQTILSVAGVFTGAVALYAALNESQAVRQQTAASVWPYVQLTISDTSDGESASFALSLDNVGVGPARMRGAMVTHRGQAVRDWQTVADVILPDGATLGIDYGKSSVSQRVLAPGESLVAFQTRHRELALGMQKDIYSGALAVTYCYCSIFDDCWIKSSTPPGQRESNQLVDQCPSFGDDGFSN